jgi:hypothetical protein
VRVPRVVVLAGHLLAWLGYVRKYQGTIGTHVLYVRTSGTMVHVYQ